MRRGCGQRAGAEADLLPGVFALEHESVELRRAGRQGAGLVEPDGLDTGEPFEGLAATEQNLMVGGVAEGGPHGHRGCQGQGAGASDQDDGEAVHQAGFEARGPGVADHGGDGDDRDDREEPGRDTVGELLVSALRCAGHSDHLDQAVERARAPGGGDLDPDVAVDVERAAVEHIPALLDGGAALAGEDLLVDAGGPAEEFAVRRDPLAGPDADPVADLDPFERHGHLAAVLDPRDLVGEERLQAFERVRGLEFAVGLQPAAGGDHDEDHAADLEVDLAVVGEHRDDRVGERGGDAGAEEQVGGRPATLQRVDG